MSTPAGGARIRNAWRRICAMRIRLLDHHPLNSPEPEYDNGVRCSVLTCRHSSSGRPSSWQTL
eukprot:scaffold22738_cov31-Tisochrysis_lutea.AAC.1